MRAYPPLTHLIGSVLTLALALCAVIPLNAAEITGTVYDADSREPLAGANIVIKGSHRGGATDLDGRFLIDELTAGSYTLEVSHVGYTPRNERVELSQASTSASLQVYLDADAVELERVVYTATRTLQLLKDVPLTTEVVTQADMRETGALTAADALESEIGIEVRNDFSGEGVMLQGVDPERVLILVDGNRVIGRINGSIDLKQLSTQGVKQIEVVKGALSTLYGSEAIGGVVNIITEEPVQPLTITAELTGGGYVPSGSGHDEPFPAAVYSPALDVSSRGENVGVQAGVRYDHAGIMDVDPSTAHTDGTEGATRLSAHGKVSWDISDTYALTLSSRFFDEDKEWVEDSGLTSVQLAFDDAEINRRLDLSAELRATPGWAEMYSFKLFRSDNRHEWGKFTQATPATRIDVSEADEIYTEFSGQFTRRLGAAHRLTTGFDVYEWDIFAHTEFSGIEDSFDGQLTAWDAYVQDEWYLLPALTLVPGVRYEQHEVYGSNISPKLSAMWAIQDDLRLRGSVGRGYRAPSSKELYFTFNHASAGYIVIGNEDLEPETSTSYTLSLEHTYKDRSTSRVSVFHNDMRNLIDFDSLTTTEQFYVGVYQYNNIVSAYTRGVEVERTMRFDLPGTAWTSSLGDLTVGLAYSYLQTHNRDTGGELLRRPRHSARMTFNWHRGAWSTRVWGRYTSSMLYQSIYTTDDQVSSEETDPYTLWNLALGYDIGPGMQVMLNVDNVFDRTHARYGPYQGRVVRATWRYTWGGWK